MPGIFSNLLVGKPAEGGFGAMPWGKHCLARQACLARRYIVRVAADPAVSGLGSQEQPARHQPPWVPLVTCMLTRLCPAVHPAFCLLGAIHASQEEVAAGRLPAQLVGCGGLGPTLPEGPLRRMAEGLRALGPASDVATGCLQPGPWCGAAPLWGNPLLQLELRGDQRSVQWGSRAVGLRVGLGQGQGRGQGQGQGQGRVAQRRQWDMGFSCLVGCPGLHTVRDLVVLMRILGWLTRPNVGGGGRGRELGSEPSWWQSLDRRGWVCQLCSTACFSSGHQGIEGSSWGWWRQRIRRSPRGGFRLW